MQEIIENYIYLYHTDQFIVLPSFPESLQDSLDATFLPTNPLLRSAPIYSYSNSGPRTVQVSLQLFRDMMTQLNYDVSNFKLEIGDDYVDTLIKQLQAIALPRYASTTKMVDPPMIAVRFGNEIFIKGVITGSISVQFQKPIITGDKYEQVQISFTVAEVMPYDAESVQVNGLMRGLNTTLERRIFKN